MFRDADGLRVREISEQRQDLYLLVCLLPEAIETTARNMQIPLATDRKEALYFRTLLKNLNEPGNVISLLVYGNYYNEGGDLLL